MFTLEILRGSTRRGLTWFKVDRYDTLKSAIDLAHLLWCLDARIVGPGGIVVWTLDQEEAPRDSNLVKDNGVSVYKPEAQAREKAASSLAPRACVGNTFEQVIPARIRVGMYHLFIWWRGEWQWQAPHPDRALLERYANEFIRSPWEILGW
jgi:hypothetical protein